MGFGDRAREIGRQIFRPADVARDERREERQEQAKRDAGWTDDEWGNPTVPPQVVTTATDTTKQDKTAAAAKAVADRKAAIQAKKEAARAAAAEAERAKKLDLTNPGTGEVAVAEHGGEFLDEGNQQKLLDTYSPALTSRGAGETTGYAVSGDMRAGMRGGSTGQQFYSGLAGSGQMNDPDMIGKAWGTLSEDVDPNLDAYYDLAFQKDQRRINRAASARGRLSSTDTMRNIQESSTELSARQAKEEADYKLKRAEAMMKGAVEGTKGKADWMTSMGDLAFNAADERREYGEAAANIANNAQLSELNRMKTGFMGALGADADQLASLQGYIGAKMDAQTARESRLSIEPDMMIRFLHEMVPLYTSGVAADATTGGEQVEGGVAGTGDDVNTQNTGDARNAALMQQQMQFMNDFFPQYGTGGAGGGASTPYTGTGPGSGAGGTYNMGGGPT